MYWIRNFFRSIFAFLTSPILWGLLGLICFFLLLWVLGPLIAIGGTHPLASEWSRIGLFVIILALVVGISYLRRRRGAKVASALANGMFAQTQGAAPAGEGAEREVNRALEYRFDQALTVLKQSRLGRPLGKGMTRWWNEYRSSNYLYDVPWYVIVGAPGTGKTTALLNSGLNFPLAERMGIERVQGVGGTRNCDWLFADRAVLVDTAGRYTTHTSDRASDSEEWGAFLDLLCKHRPRQPINGVVVAISVQDLLQGSTTELEQQAMAIRARLQELRDHIKIEFPVYLMVTKVDLVAGFTEFFGDLKEDEQRQVWGATFPLGGDENKRSYDEQFEGEFDGLMTHVTERVLDLMEPERDARRRGKSYLFPQHFEALRAPLKVFLRAAFMPSPYEKSMLLRGFYFSSGAQVGSPINPSFQRLAAPLGLQAAPSAARTGETKSYFITQLLNEVIFGEAGLAGTNRAWFRRKAFLSGAGYALIVMLVVALLIGWTTSYVGNAHYIEAVGKQVPTARTTVEAINTSKDSPLNDSLPGLAALETVAYANGVDHKSIPLTMRFGLFQGDKLLAASDDAYYRLLQDTLLPRIVFRLEEVLRDRNADPEDKYAALRTYLMINQSEHYDEKKVSQWVRGDWDKNLSAEVTLEQRGRLAQHLARLVERGPISSPLPYDEALVVQVRREIAAISLAERIYKQMKRSGVGANLRPFSVPDVAGPSAMLVFERASKKPLAEGVPGIYSLRGYYQVFLKEVDTTTLSIASEYNWVMGIDVAKSPDGKDLLYAGDKLEALIRDVKKLYLLEYGDQWEKFLADIRIKPFNGLEQSIQSVRVLAAADSPIKLMMAAVVREVSLTQIADEDKSLLQMADEALKERTKRLGSLLGTSNPANDVKVENAYRIERTVDDRFNDLRRQVRGAGAGAPPQLDASMTLLNEFYNYQMSANTAVKAGMAPPQSDITTRIRGEAERQAEPMRSILRSMVEKSDAQISHGAGAVIGASLDSSVRDFCVKAINNRYPFTRSASLDVKPDDFVKLFGGGGVLDDFFQKNLAQYTDTTHATWTFRKMGDGQAVTGGASLPLFQKAAVIRDVFLKSSGSGPSVRVEIKPVDMDPQLLQIIVDIDGQIVKYAHGPQLPQTVSWPGPRGSNQVRIQYSFQGSSEPVTKVYDGTWALFRALDDAQIVAGSGPEVVQASFGKAGAQARFDISAMGVRNPFKLPELASFRCPSQL